MNQLQRIFVCRSTYTQKQAQSTFRTFDLEQHCGFSPLVASIHVVAPTFVFDMLVF